MRRLSFAALATAVGLASLSRPTAAYAYQGGELKNHSHSSVAGQGGNTLSPGILNVSTPTVSGNFQQNGAIHKISSAAFIVDGTGATVSFPSGSIPTTALSGSLSFSTYTAIPSTVFTQTSCNVCAATVAFVVTAAMSTMPLEIFLAADVTNNSIQATGWRAWGNDGTVSFPFTGTVGARTYTGTVNMGTIAVTAAGHCNATGRTIPVGTLAAGSYSACIALCTTSGTNAQFVIDGFSCVGQAMSSRALFGIQNGH